MGLILCCIAFAAVLVATWRSAVAGLSAMLVAGYSFGILRANCPDTYSHFIADAAVVGFYLSYFTKNWRRPRSADEKGALNWTWILIGWAGLMFLVPF